MILIKASRRRSVVWWEILLMMLSMFKAQLVMDWSQTTTHLHIGVQPTV